MKSEKRLTRWPLRVHRAGAGYGWVSNRTRKSTNLESSRNRLEAASALLVYAESEPLHTLRVALAGQGFDTWRARSYRHALTFLANFKPVHVIFSAMNLPDGTWLDLAGATRRISVPLIVVAREMDANLWSGVIQQGGAGLIAPPFAASDLIYPVQRSRSTRCSDQGSLQKRTWVS
jgi:DNA-binding NtrC family response regulator